MNTVFDASKEALWVSGRSNTNTTTYTGTFRFIVHTAL